MNASLLFKNFIQMKKINKLLVMTCLLLSNRGLSGFKAWFQKSPMFCSVLLMMPLINTWELTVQSG